MPLHPCNETYTGTTTTTKPLQRAARAGRLVKATYAQELATAGATVTAQLRNATRAVNMSAALDVNGKGALYGADFVVNTDGSADFAAGDLLVVVLTFGTGTLGPGEFCIILDQQYGMFNDAGVGG